MRKPKIVVIGAGSASFGLTNLGAIMRTEAFHGATLALCDLKEDGLVQIKALADRINEEWGSEMTVEADTDRTRLLPGADFVIISVAIDREKCWKQDFELGKKYGLIHYAENGGPGGFFHAARNVALLMPVFKDIERLCPQALVLNFTNPMTRICTAASRYSKVKLVGICHQIDHGYMMAARILGPKLGMDVDDRYLFRWDSEGDSERNLIDAAHARFDILAAGINHFTWYRSIKDKETGEELLPLFKKLFVEQNPQRPIFEPYTRELISVFDECPTSGDAHLLEYLPYTGNMNRHGWERLDIQMYPLDNRAARRDNMWLDIAEMAAGRKSVEPLRHVHTERAELIMASVWNNQHGYDYAVNLPNTQGYIANMDRDAIVEVPAVMNQHGVQGIAMGELPPVVAAFCNRQKVIVDYAVKGMVEGDYASALKALAMDPMVDDLDMARGILNDGLKLYKKYLPQFE